MLFNLPKSLYKSGLFIACILTMSVESIAFAGTDSECVCSSTVELKHTVIEQRVDDQQQKLIQQLAAKNELALARTLNNKQEPVRLALVSID